MGIRGSFHPQRTDTQTQKSKRWFTTSFRPSLGEGAGKRCSECDPDARSEHRFPVRKDVVNQCLGFDPDVQSGPQLKGEGLVVEGRRRDGGWDRCGTSQSPPPPPSGQTPSTGLLTTSFLPWRKVPESDARSVCPPTPFPSRLL